MHACSACVCTCTPAGIRACSRVHVCMRACVCVCACLCVREHAYARACLWLYAGMCRTAYLYIFRVEQIRPYYTMANFADFCLFRQFPPQQRPFSELPWNVA
jgi:hypothetical protein